MFKKTLSLFVIVCFCLTSLTPYLQAHADSILNLPAAGTMINLSPAYQPVIIKGLIVHKDNPFLFDFIIDVGQDRMSGGPLKKEGEKLIKYFLASLAIPDQDLWVNLSPYEKNRMIPEALGQTDMGRDLLEQDYILKQITASLIYPEKRLGKTFWDTVYAKAQQKFGTTQVPVNTFNKVWIMADKAEVFEHNQSAFVVGCHLKVMLEEDYLALTKHKHQPNAVILSEGPHAGHSQVAPKDLNRINSLRDSSATPQNDSHFIASQIIRQIILPELEKEVNTGKNFANLRQIFNSVILSSWYRKNLKEALLNQVYANKSNVNGVIASQAKQSREEIYEQYLKAYKKGVFNYIKEDINAANGQTMPRKYFSGGTIAAVTPEVETDPAMGARDLAQSSTGNQLEDFATLASTNSTDAAMKASTLRLNVAAMADGVARHLNKPIALLQLVQNTFRKEASRQRAAALDPETFRTFSDPDQKRFLRRYGLFFYERGDDRAGVKKFTNPQDTQMILNAMNRPKGNSILYQYFVSFLKHDISSFILRYQLLRQIIESRQRIASTRYIPGSQYLEIISVPEYISIRPKDIDSVIEYLQETIGKDLPFEVKPTGVQWSSRGVNLIIKTEKATINIHDFDPIFDRVEEAMAELQSTVDGLGHQTRKQFDLIRRGVVYEGNKGKLEQFEPSNLIRAIADIREEIHRQQLEAEHETMLLPLSGGEEHTALLSIIHNRGLGTIPFESKYLSVAPNNVSSVLDLLTNLETKAVESRMEETSAAMSSFVSQVKLELHQALGERAKDASIYTFGGNILRIHIKNLDKAQLTRIKVLLPELASKNISISYEGHSTINFDFAMVDQYHDYLNIIAAVGGAAGFVGLIVYLFFGDDDAMLTRIELDDQSKALRAMEDLNDQTIQKAITDAQRAADLKGEADADKMMDIIMELKKDPTILNIRAAQIHQGRSLQGILLPDGNLPSAFWDNFVNNINEASATITANLENMVKALHGAYERSETDEFVKPIVLVDGDGKPVGRIKSDDVVFTFNFRRDRMNQITAALAGLASQIAVKVRNLKLIKMMFDENQAPNEQLVFPPKPVKNNLGEWLSYLGLSQLRIAETEKFNHVTRFLNGGSSMAPNVGEERQLIPSPKVATYDLQPEMSAQEVTEKLITAVEADQHDFYAVNFAQPDMVGHTGNLEAAIKAVAQTSKNVGEVVKAAREKGVNVIIIADHGNVDQMKEKSGSPHTRHTTSPVPFVFIPSKNAVLTGIPKLNTYFSDRPAGLSDVAPSILQTLGKPRPSEMTGQNLIEGYDFPGKQKTLLIIMDGLGINPNREDSSDAVRLASEQGLTPDFDKLFSEELHTKLEASGTAVGLPEGQFGNSEVGHRIIGAGRILEDQPLTVVNAAIKNGSYFKNEALLEGMRQAKENGKAFHMVGLVSAGGVHSSIEHIYATLRMAKEQGLSQVYIHAILDGRDTDPKSAEGFLRDLQAHIDQIGIGKIVDLVGRYYPMDRDNNWNRTAVGYDLYVDGKAEASWTDAAMLGVGQEQQLGFMTQELNRIGAKVTKKESLDGLDFESLEQIERGSEVGYQSNGVSEASPYQLGLIKLHARALNLQAIIDGLAKARNKVDIAIEPDDSANWKLLLFPGLKKFSSVVGKISILNRLYRLGDSIKVFIRKESGADTFREISMQSALEYLKEHPTAALHIPNLARRSFNHVFLDAAMSPGGIDLNTSNGMQWKVRGNSVEMNVDPAMLARIEREGVEWLSPVILRMTPVSAANVWSLAGLQAPIQMEHSVGV